MDQAERLRNIIKNQNRRQHLAKVITVTSGKGGVGKSNISVNLAITLSKMGKRVVILDADLVLRILRSCSESGRSTIWPI